MQIFSSTDFLIQPRGRSWGCRGPCIAWERSTSYPKKPLGTYYAILKREPI